MNPDDYRWECTNCGEERLAVYTFQLKCRECGGTEFTPADQKT